jgi:hypothetical protein
VIGITECYGDSWLTPFRGQRCTRELEQFGVALNRLV